MLITNGWYINQTPQIVWLNILKLCEVTLNLQLI